MWKYLVPCCEYKENNIDNLEDDVHESKKSPMYEQGIPKDMIDVSIYDVDKIRPFTLQGLKLKCKAIKVYDGDTVELIVPFYGKPFNIRCRLNGIDAAKLKSKDPEEREVAVMAKDYLSDLILDKMVWVDCGSMDKYGRILGDIYLDRCGLFSGVNSCSDLLIRKKYAYAYQGGKKLCYTDWRGGGTYI